VKDILMLHHNGSELLINTTNNGPLGVHRLAGKSITQLAAHP